MGVQRHHGRRLIRVPPAWDGAGAAAVLLLLALVRFVTSSLSRLSTQFATQQPVNSKTTLVRSSRAMRKPSALTLLLVAKLNLSLNKTYEC